MKVRERELHTDYIKAYKDMEVKIEADGYKIIKTEDSAVANVDWNDMGFDKPPVAENTRHTQLKQVSIHIPEFI